MLCSLSAWDNAFQENFTLIFNVRNQPSIFINFNHKNSLIRTFIIVLTNQIVE